MTDVQAGVEVRLPICLADDPPVPAGWDAAAFRALPRSEQFVLWCATSALADAGYDDDEADCAIGLVLGSGGELLRRWEGDWYAGGREVYAGRNRFADAGRKCACGNCKLNGPVRDDRRRLCQRQLCHRPGPPLDRAGPGRCLPGRRRRNGHAHLPLGLQQSAGPLAAGRRAAEGLAALRRGSRRLRHGRRGGDVGPGIGRARPPPRRRVYAEVAGFGATSDAFHMIIPSSDPAPAAAAMQAALADAGIEPHEVDYINAHATSTPVGDKGEARALHAVFGEHVANVPVSSTKSMTGHLLSAAAAVEALACLAAIERQANSADDQSRHARSRVRPVPRAAPGDRAPGQRRPLQLLRLRRQQHDAGAAESGVAVNRPGPLDRLDLSVLSRPLIYPLRRPEFVVARRCARRLPS